MSRSAKKRQTLLLLLAALLIRAGIPDGYMPSAPGSGLLFELCPAGVPAGFLTALAGAGHHHHHDMSDSSESHFDAAQCPIGHLLASAVALGDVWQFDAAPELPEFVDTPVRLHASRLPANRHSRDPPA